MIDQRMVEAYEKHSADLICYATALVGAQEAEDVVADAILRIFRTTDWDRVVEARGYLFRCVLNEVRRRARRTPLARASARLLIERSDDHAPALDELGVFRKLSARERAVVYLAYWEDTAIADIADTLAISDGAVRRYLARARTKLREELSHE